MPKYLYDTLSEYINRGVYPFHMPGHKGDGSFFDGVCPAFDTTEIGLTDNLYAPSGAIRRSQERAASVFGADGTFFLVNGSTAGVITAILSCVREGDEVLIARNAHRSVFSGLILSGAVPRYVLPDITPFGAAGGVSARQIEKAMAAYPGIKAAVITSPSYEGFTSNVDEIARILHERNALLIVDEAHGAHSRFHNAFPKPALDSGADIVIQSLHKTLPALGQSALLHIKGPRADKHSILKTLPLIQTSSPSYLLMAAADRLIGGLEAGELDFNAYIDMLLHARLALGTHKRIRLAGRELVDTHSISDIDISKLVFHFEGESLTGGRLMDTLASEYGVQLEMSAQKYALGISTIADTSAGLNRLVNAINNISACISGSSKDSGIKKETASVLPEMVLTPRQAMQMKTVSLPVDKCINRISGGFLIPYPPGIPIVAPGERINEQILVFLRENAGEIPIMGIHCGCINVIC